MVRNIGFYYNIQTPKQLSFKSENNRFSSVSDPIEPQNLSGTDALASYNSAFIDVRKDNLDIPVLKPLEMPNNILNIDGEKIYNSKGVLECVIKDTGDKKYVYSNRNKNEMRLDVVNKETGIKELEQGMYTNDDGSVHTWIASYDKSTGKQQLLTDYEDNKLVAKTLIKYDKGKRKSIEYYYDNKTYYVTEDDSARKYDIDKNLTYEYIRNKKADGYETEETKYLSGKPISHTKEKIQGIVSDKYSSYIKDPNLQRTPCPNFISSIDDIEGQKTYYSNGQLESVRTADGKLYEQSFDKSCITLTDGNKTISFENDIDYGHGCCIREDLGSAIKTTNYFAIDKNQEGNITYSKGNVSKFVFFNKDGKPVKYEEEDETEKNFRDRLVLGINYAPDGFVINVYNADTGSLDVL